MNDLSAERLIAVVERNAHLAIASEGGHDLEWGIRHESKLTRQRARVYRQTYPVPQGTIIANKNPNAFRTVPSYTNSTRRICYAWRNWDVINGIPCGDFVLIILNEADKVNGDFVITQLVALERMLSIKRMVHAHLDHLSPDDAIGTHEMDNNHDPVFIQTAADDPAANGNSADI